MIVSKNIDINIELPVSNEKILNALSAKGIKPLRWAIIQVKENIFTISVSYETQC